MNDNGGSGDKPGVIERQSREFLKRVRNDPRAMRRAERIPGGRSILRFAERLGEGWEPDLNPDEQLQLNRGAERVTRMGPTAGRLFLTDQRLIFEPVMQPFWFSMSVELPRDGLCVKRSGLLSQLLHLRPLIGPLFGPRVVRGWIHVANIKISRGRTAAWFRVQDTDEWERAITAVANEEDKQ